MKQRHHPLTGDIFCGNKNKRGGSRPRPTTRHFNCSQTLHDLTVALSNYASAQLGNLFCRGNMFGPVHGDGFVVL